MTPNTSNNKTWHTVVSILTALGLLAVAVGWGVSYGGIKNEIKDLPAIRACQANMRADVSGLDRDIKYIRESLARIESLIRDRSE